MLIGRNPPYGRGIAFWALGEILRQAAAGVRRTTRSPRSATRWRGAHQIGADDAAELAEALVAALGGAPGGDVEDQLKRLAAPCSACSPRTGRW